jgi:hypothetical protein
MKKLKESITALCLGVVVCVLLYMLPTFIRWRMAIDAWFLGLIS